MITKWIDRYERWEARRRSRFARWSVSRRWATFVLVPILALCCCGGVVAAPAAWFLRITLQAGKGAVAADAAASEYLQGLGYGQEDGLLPLLGNDKRLLQQWRSYRALMVGTQGMGPPATFDFGALAVQQLGHGRALVVTDVRATWFPKDGSGGFLNSSALTWRIETREDDGWRVSRVEPPAWCGGYVLASACGTK